VIQILGLRTFKDENGKEIRYDAFYDKQARKPQYEAKDIYDLFHNMQERVKQVPAKQHWNLFYTIATCTNEKRQFLRQDALPIDIDGIEAGTEDQIVECVLTELKLPRDKVGIVYTGNGVHIIIGLKTPITEASYFNKYRPYYKALCGRINGALFDAGIKGNADPVVFSEGRLLRIGFTRNLKPDKGEKESRLVEGNLQPLDVDLFSLADLPSLDEGDHISPVAYARLPEPDTEAVLSGCSFIQHCKDTEEKLPEPMWYAMLSIVGRLKDGLKLAAEYSIPKGKKHDKYTHLGYHPNVERKVQHATEAAGPRTCSNISGMYEGCKSCPHFGKITSPIQITSPETIRSKSNGFYDVVFDKDGMPKNGKPNYDDLVKWFAKQHQYITLEESKVLMVWTGTHWKEMHQSHIHNFAEKNFNPTPSNTMCLEFESKLKRTNLRDQEFINVQGFLNFKNGVLNLDTGAMSVHDKAFGFTYIIPYDYTPTKPPRIFEKFLEDVSCGDEKLADLIAEYMGYCISGTDPSLVQKCAILYGDGANGKSVLLSLLRELVGRENSSAVSMPNMSKENHRYAMMNKLFNASDEAPTNSFLDSSVFKSIVSGDIIEVRRLYMEPMMWKCTSKLIFNCNDLPHMGDYSHGMSRRLLIIPFNATFSREAGNLDPHMLSKLLSEKSDILKYCLDKFMVVKNRDYNFTEAESVKEELEDYKFTSDHVERFVQTMCRYKHESPALPVSLVYTLFVSWCEDSNIKPMVYSSFVNRFGKALTKRLVHVEKTRPRGDNKRVIAYKNLIIDAVTTDQLGANV
jgi:P4 family phage/plasmid primase-like protien